MPFSNKVSYTASGVNAGVTISIEESAEYVSEISYEDAWVKAHELAKEKAESKLNEMLKKIEKDDLCVVNLRGFPGQKGPIGPTGPIGPLVTIKAARGGTLAAGAVETFPLNPNKNNEFLSVGTIIAIDQLPGKAAAYYLIIGRTQFTLTIQNISKVDGAWGSDAGIALVGPQGPPGSSSDLWEISETSIFHTGNVGINTSDAKSALDVAGALNATEDSTISGLTIGKGSGSIASNTLCGSGSLVSNTTGANNTAVGVNSLRGNTTGYNNTSIGFQSLDSNTTGGDNTGVGVNTLLSNTTGNQNTAVNKDALKYNTTGSNNTAIGFDSLHSNTTGNYNTAVGVISLFTNTTGSNNTAFGYGADVASAALTNSTAIGYGAICSSSDEIKLGNDAVKTLVCAGSLQTPLDATISGVTLGKGSGSIATNTLCGSGALLVNTTGYDNTALGVSSLSKNTTGHNNTAIGLQSIQINTTGAYNTGVGVNSILGNTTGIQNTAVGVDSLKSNGTGSQNTAIGCSANVASNNLNNCTAIGYGAICDASNQITLGNSLVGAVRYYGTLTSLSDERDKKDVEDLESSLAFIEQLKPVRFKWNMRDGGKVDVPEIGFIAQDLQQVQKDTGITIPNLVYDVNPEKLEASYGALLPLLVKSIQELSQKIKELEKK